jgi:hypothetical protein
MKDYSLADIKKELKHFSKEELVNWYIDLIKFKKINKGFSTFQVFHSQSEAQFVELVKADLTEGFQELNHANDFYIKKGLQKINRQLTLVLSYPLTDVSKIELSIYFLEEFNRHVGRKKNHTVIYNIYLRVLAKLEKWVAKLHEDLQFDFEEKISDLRR